MKNGIFTVCVLAAAAVCGCSSGVKKLDITTTNETSNMTADMGEFSPDPGYNQNIRNRNNFIALDLKIDTIDSQNSPVPDNLNSESISLFLQNEFAKSKRFTVVSPDRAKDASIHIKVRANVTYSKVDTTAVRAFGYALRMAFTGYNRDGIQEFELNVEGAQARQIKKNFTGKFVTDPNVDNHLLMLCVSKCFKTVYPVLCRRYPISGNVASVRNTGSKTVFRTDRTGDDGVTQGMPFVIGYTDSDGNEIFVAKGRATSVGGSGTQISVEEWNPEERNAVKLCQAKIAAGDKAFVENMFFVSKYRKVGDVK